MRTFYLLVDYLKYYKKQSFSILFGLMYSFGERTP